MTFSSVIYKETTFQIILSLKPPPLCLKHLENKNKKHTQPSFSGPSPAQFLINQLDINRDNIYNKKALITSLKERVFSHAFLRLKIIATKRAILRPDNFK
jgi:hypothetical protein